MSKEVSHDGHRQRLKNRFLSTGLSGFEPHNILELLLFYSIPRKDTNEIAHLLINRFGSLKNVFDADIGELMKVKGVSENTATLIKLIPELLREYSVDEYNKERIFDTADKIGKYFIAKYTGETKEIVYVMLLDNRFELIKVVKIFEGSVNSTQVSPRKIIDEVVKTNASMVILAHNHPNGKAEPSVEDYDTTSNIVSAFRMFDIKLAEHFIIAGNSYYPMIRQNFCENEEYDTDYENEIK